MRRRIRRNEKEKEKERKRKRKGRRRRGRKGRRRQYGKWVEERFFSRKWSPHLYKHAFLHISSHLPTPPPPPPPFSF